MKFYYIAALGLSLYCGAATIAHAQAPVALAASAFSTGEIVKVDKANGKLTIKHGPLANLDMPGMTMVFKASSPAMLDQVQPGDQVRFVADKVDGVLTVTVLERRAAPAEK